MNIKLTKNENKITLEMPTSGGVSKSGKSEIVASTYGAVPVVVDGEVLQVNVNIYKKKTDRPLL
jgi:hypothetical protein